MALEPCEPEDCDRCAGRPSPHNKLCAQCMKGLEVEVHLDSEITYGTDREGRRHLDKRPDDPSQN